MSVPMYRSAEHNPSPAKTLRCPWMTRYGGWAKASFLAVLLAWSVLAGSAVGSRQALARPRRSLKTVRDEPYPEKFQRRVNGEIQRRANLLLVELANQGREGRPAWSVGEQALAVLALLRCGVPRDSAPIAEALGGIRRGPPQETYVVSVSAMALAAQYEPSRDAFAPDTIDASGRHVLPPVPAGVNPVDRAWLQEAVSFLVESQQIWSDSRRFRKDGAVARGRSPRHRHGGSAGSVVRDIPRGWGYPGSRLESASADWIDVSNTQYALLGLKAAARCGVRVPASTWASALALLLEWQSERGQRVRLRGNEVRGERRVEWMEAARARGYAYTGPAGGEASVTGGRTAAGVGSLMICQSELWDSPRFAGPLRERTRIAIRDGLAWMQRHFTVTTNPGRDTARALRGSDGSGYDPWYASYLYAMERTGVMGHIRFIGDHDWYAEGAEELIRRQGAGLRMRADACFDLLFLSRASFRTTNPVITPREPNGVGSEGQTPGDRGTPPE